MPLGRFSPGTPVAEIQAAYIVVAREGRIRAGSPQKVYCRSAWMMGDMAKFFNKAARGGVAKVVHPVATRLVRAGVSPDAVTIFGTAGVVAGAVLLAARGHLLWALLVVGCFVCLDMLDGAMARVKGASSRYGALLDSTMDRVADGAVFASLAYFAATSGDKPAAAAALICLVGAMTVSYVKARAESLGTECTVGLAERPERLVMLGVGGLVAGLGVPYALSVTLWLLAAATVFTVAQRLWHVRGQLNGDQRGEGQTG